MSTKSPTTVKPSMAKKQIKIIVDAPIYDLGSISDEEREIFFERIGSKFLTKPQIDMFILAYNELLKTASERIRPDLPELLIRKIIKTGQVIPILSGLKSESGKFGGKPKEELVKNPTAGEKHEKQLTFPPVRVRFDHLVNAEVSGVGYVIPIGEEAEIVGFKITPTCSAIWSFLLYGFYNHVDYAKSCENVSPLLGAREKRKNIVSTLNHDETPIELFDALVDAAESADESGPYVYAKIRIDITNKTGPFELLKQGSYKMPDEQPRDKLLDFLETIHKGKFRNVYESAVFADITLRGLGPIYYRALIKGRDHKDVKAEIAEMQERVIRAKFQADLKRKKFIELTRLNTFKLIIEQKLGAERLQELGVLHTVDDLLKKLKPNERKLVELEFDMKEKYLAAASTNSCPHVKLYRDFRRSNAGDAKKSYDELKKYFVAGSQSSGNDNGSKNGSKNSKTPKFMSSQIQCRNCHFDIICPHLRDLTEMENANRLPSDIKAALNKYTSPIKDQYFCNICGELVASLEIFESPELKQILDEELSNTIWGEVASLMKYLKFGKFVNVTSFISVIRDTIYPYIFEIEKQILKSKTNSADEIRAKRRLYITIYGFAYLSHLVLANNEVSFAGIDAKKPTAVDVIKHIMRLIIMSRNIIIREIPGMVPDIIKNVLIEAYKSINAGTQIITHTETDSLLNTLLIDPIYHYIYSANTIAEAIANKSVVGFEEKYDFVDRLDELMGDSIQKLEKSSDLYMRVKMPFESNKSESNKSESVFKKFMERLSNRDPLYMMVSHDKSQESIPDVQFRPSYDKYFAELSKLKTEETKNRRPAVLAATHNYNFMQPATTRMWKDPGTKLGRLYDEEGNPHVFSIYVYSEARQHEISQRGASELREISQRGSRENEDNKANKKDKSEEKTKEFTAKDIVKQLESGPMEGALIDYKCSICGVLKSKSFDLSEEKIRESLRSRKAVANFFKVYENRCPEDGLHDFSGNKCSKCHVETSFFSDSTSAAKTEYYNKYHKASVNEQIAEEIEIVPAKVLDFPEYHTYAFNFNVITKLAEAIGVNFKLLTAMCGFERKEYQDVVSGKYNPGETENRYDTRIFMLDTNIKNLITEYNQLRYYYNLTKPLRGIPELIENVDKSIITDLHKLLPDIYAEYNEKFQYIQGAKKPREIVSFCIQTLCEKCIAILEDSESKTAKLREAFVKEFMGKILRNDEMVSKPGQFNWSILSGNTGESKETADMNTAEENDNDEDVPEGDSEVAPMNTEDLDIDMEPEDVDPDGNEQDIKLDDSWGGE